mmetsp:Transcript_4410/g.6888  ORF Transcript_4410/g.6888 Transcript_4410/m.6888 type:complete len:256 (+) Transcript_4410:142-909(+)
MATLASRLRISFSLNVSTCKEHRQVDVRRGPRSRSAVVTVASASMPRTPGDRIWAAFFAAAATATVSLAAPHSTEAGTPKGQGVLSTDETGRAVSDLQRCSLQALGKAASTRAAFSDMATQQNEELYVNVEGCDFSNMDLSKEVLSGIKARGANFSNSIFGPECSRADFSDANLAGTVMRSVNLYNTSFAGANLEGADLTGALAPGAYFGADAQTGRAANLKGTVFEDTLLSTSDVRAVCLNRTLDFESKMSLGC